MKFKHHLSAILSVAAFPSLSRSQVVALCRDTVSAQAPIVRAALRSAKIEPENALPAIRLCGESGLYAVAGIAPARRAKTDYGPRVVIFRVANNVSRLLFTSHGLTDSNVPDLYAAAGPGRTLVLADLGNEGSWGIGAYEVHGHEVRELPHLDIGLPSDARSGDPDASVFRLLRAGWADGTWAVQVDTTAIVLRPNSVNPQVSQVKQHAPIAFRLQGGAWRRY
jgi:hypothetical protein